MLRFTRLPTQALRTVLQALERDESFRDRVAGGAEESSLDRASWLFLTRPEGWEDELQLLRSAASEEQAEESASRQEQSAERRLTQVEENLARLRTELRDARRGLAVAEESLAGERAGRLRLESEREALGARLGELEQERARAVRSLKDVESRATARLEELRAAQQRLAAADARISQLEDAADEAPTPDRGPSPELPPVREHLPAAPASPPVDPRPRSAWDGADPAAVAVAVERAAAAAALLGDALADAARSLTTAGRTDAAGEDDLAAFVSAPTDEPARTAAPSGPRPPRRTPIRLTRGVHEGSAEGVEQLLATPGVVAIVDGYNVSMEAWPLLDRSAQRSSLIAMLGVLQARTGAAVHAVFDGDDDGRRPAVGAPLPVRVHFSHAEVEADDLVLDMVARLPTDRPVVVVSSDRRVQDGARRLGANVVRSCELLALARA